MIEGMLDLAFEENGVTVVVDFKTDHELAAGEDRYRAQVQQYVNAVARATGCPPPAFSSRCDPRRRLIRRSAGLSQP